MLGLSPSLQGGKQEAIGDGLTGAEFETKHQLIKA